MTSSKSVWVLLFKTLIRGYRLILSPLLGRRCRFEPSCSAYAMEALDTHGALSGLWITVKRLLRCHPFCSGGWDPVPESCGKACRGRHEAEKASVLKSPLSPKCQAERP